jgi:hypothetical protein
MQSSSEGNSKDVVGRVLELTLLPVGFAIATAVSSLFMLVIAAGVIRDVTWRR